MSFEAPDWRTSGISWPSVVLMKTVLKDFIGCANEEGVARAWRPVLAKEYDVTERSITRVLDALETLGYIKRTRTTWRGKPWRALAFRVVVQDASTRAEPSEAARLAAEVTRLRRELAAQNALADEANDALDALEGAEVVELAQRADADDERPSAGEEMLREHIYDLVLASKLQRADVENVPCPRKCGCGGRYRIRTCDFVRVKDAVKLVPSREQLDDQAQIVRAAYLQQRSLTHKIGPGSFRVEPPRDAWEAMIVSCEAVAVEANTDLATASAAVMRAWFSRGGKEAGARHPVDWFGVGNVPEDCERKALDELANAAHKRRAEKRDDAELRKREAWEREAQRDRDELAARKAARSLEEATARQVERETAEAAAAQRGRLTALGGALDVGSMMEALVAARTGTE